jgi:hypothetical protein
MAQNVYAVTEGWLENCLGDIRLAPHFYETDSGFRQSSCKKVGARITTMEPGEPRMQPDIEEFVRVCERIIEMAYEKGGLTDGECEEIVCIVYVVGQVERSVDPYGDLDDLAASVAVSKLPSLSTDSP